MADYNVKQQRTASSSSSSTESAAASWKNLASGGAATAVAIGSIAWYYHMFGRPLHAMTPAEEGYDAMPDEMEMDNDG
jgi:ubiquinol-cytochrome c reductase cytochrome c1 subunit